MVGDEKLAPNTAVSREGEKVPVRAPALLLSREHDISLKEIGDTCNGHGIDIAACKMGCFE